VATLEDFAIINFFRSFYGWCPKRKYYWQILRTLTATFALLLSFDTFKPV